VRILVTGGAGFIGSHIVDAYINAGHDVAIIDNLSTGNFTHVNFKADFLDLDILELPIMKPRVGPFDVICHQAAQPSLLYSHIYPMQDASTNILGTLRMLNLADKWGAHFILASTSAVYDEDLALPISEGDRTEPTRPYGISKLAAENYVRALATSHTVFRYGNVYGPRQIQVGENQLVPHALAHMIGNDPFKINGTGEHSRDFIYVKDLAAGVLMATETTLAGTYNLSSGYGTRVNSVLGMIKEIYQWNGSWSHGQDVEGEPERVELSIDKMRAAGWEPKWPMIDGLGETIDAWLRKENERESIHSTQFRTR
jgi:UDP-glucose 4-epimerase